MSKVCITCSNSATYKCPVCYIFYCSAKCCKVHRGNGCTLLEKKEPSVNQENIKRTQVSEEVSSERLQLLKNSEDVRNALTNPHLRNLLITVDSADKPEEMMQKAMLEPIFREFADACIRAVESDAHSSEEQT